MAETTKNIKNFITLHHKGIVLLSLTFLLALYLRLMTHPLVFQGDHVVFLETDPYYHLRRIIPFTTHFPRVFTFDHYFNYPQGSGIGWPPLFDQGIAATALLLGLGAPGTHLIETIAAYTPALLGAITILPLFFLTRLVFNWKTGIIAALFLAVLPAHLQVSQLGFTDHHVAELLLSLTAYALFLASIQHQQRNSLPILSGISFALLLLLWLGSPLFIAIILLHTLAWFTLNHYKGGNTEIFAKKGVFIFTTATLTTLLYYLLFPDTWQPALLQTSLSLFQPLLLFATALSYPVLAGLSKLLSEKNKHLYPLSLLLLSGSALLLLQVTAPELLNNILWGAGYLARGGTLGQVVEALPLFYTFNGRFTAEVAWNTFNITLLLTPLALLLFARQCLRGEMKHVDHGALFFIIWTGIIFLITLQQRRFTYLAAANVAILTGYLLHTLHQEITRRLSNTTAPQPKTLTIVLLLCITLLLAAPGIKEDMEMAEHPLQIPQDWYNTLQWLEHNTPATTNWSTPEGMPEYSVLAWWDYGNWIMYIARRPVVANNFQVGAIDATRFFLAQNESTSNQIMDERGARYVIADYRLGLNKFRRGNSIILAGTFFSAAYLLDEDISTYLTPSGEPNQKYYNTTYARLHLFDGAGLAHYRLIHESTSIAVNLFRKPTPRIKVYQYVKGAAINGTTTPGTHITATLPITTNTGRRFTYTHSTTPDTQGHFNLTVPYPGEYTLQAGGNTRTVSISEEDVEKGNNIYVGRI